jgi:hemoglobin/transferrin/lactoferrin receptor protein
LGFGLFFILLAGVSFAQGRPSAGYIQGKVLDSETGNPLSGASVLLQELNTGVSTGNEGTFSLAGLREGTYILRASRLGYASQVITATVPQPGPLTILLAPSPVVTEEIVTTARGRETDRHDIPGSVEVVNAEEIKERIPVSIPEALSRKPGLAVSSDMPWSQRVVVRGLQKDQVILFVDGARVVTASETAAEFGTIAHGDIERVEVLKGPISVLYGSGSTGGVVNVITRKGRFSEKPQVKFSLNPTFESAAEGLGMYERAEWSSRRMYLSLSQSNRDYASYKAAGDREVRNSQFRDRQTQENFGLRLSSRHVLEARRQDFKASDVGVPGARSFPAAGVARYPLTTRKLTDVSWTWHTPATWWRESRVNAYYQPIHRDVNLVPGTVQNAPGKRTTVELIHPGAFHKVSGARWQNVLAFGGHTVVAGVEGWQKDMESYRSRQVKVEMLDSEGNVTKTVNNTIRDLPLPNSMQRPVGVFAEDAFSIGKRVKVILGGRFDLIHTENDLTFKQYAPMDSTVLWPARNDTDRSWSFVAGAVYGLTDNLDLNLTLARSFRAPTIEERYLYADLGGVLTVGNPLIDPEEGAFVEGGVSAQLGSLKLTGQAYLNSLSNMVTQKWGTFHDGRNAWVAANAGKAHLWGFETAADWVVSRRLLLSGDFSFTRGTDTKANANLPFMPPARGHLSVRWNAGKGYWIEPLATFVARQEKIAAGERITPGYGTFDLTLGKTISFGNGLSQDLALGIKNVGDKLYRDHLATSRGYEMYGLGRSLYVSIRANYH